MKGSLKQKKEKKAAKVTIETDANDIMLQTEERIAWLYILVRRLSETITGEIITGFLKNKGLKDIKQE